MLNLVLADDGLLNAADGGGAGDLRDFQSNLKADFVIGMDPRSDVDVDADVYVGELCVDQRVDGSGADADACLEAAGGDGDAAADVELGGLAVNGTDFGILNDLGGGVSE